MQLLQTNNQTKPIQIDSSDLKIPLANGNVMNIPLSAINITEEVNKSGIWKQVNDGNSREKDNNKKKSPKSNG